jgi:thiol-disulfide isomerase/thioredoxin
MKYHTFLLFVAMFISVCSWGQSISIQTSPEAKSPIKFYMPFDSRNYPGLTQPLPLKGGIARIDAKVMEPRLAYLSFPGHMLLLYLQPGKHLQVVIDTTLQNGYRFIGDLSSENTVINQLMFNTNNSNLSQTFMALKEEPEKLAKKLLALKDKQLNSFDSICRIKQLMPTFQLKYRQELRYFYANVFNDVLTNWYFQNKKVNDSLYQRWTSAGDKFFSLEPVSNPDALGMPEYKKFLWAYYQYNALIKRQANDIPLIEKLLAKNKDEIKADVMKLYGSGIMIEFKLAEQYFTGKVLEYYQAVLITREAKELNNIAALEGYDQFRAAHPKSVYLAVLDGVIQPILKFKTAGSLANGSHIINPGGITSLKETLLKFKGKVIYMDTWATWCGPCKEEFPFIPDMKKALAGKDIVYLYVSIDRNEYAGKWRDLINFSGLEGFHIRVGNEGMYMNELMKLLEIKDGTLSIPRHGIIDKNGNFVNTNAAGPRNIEDLIAELDKYL